MMERATIPRPTRPLPTGPRLADAWQNWAGDQICRPLVVERPGSLEELTEAVVRAAEADLSVRITGSGHSFTEAALTGGAMIRIEQLNRVLEADRGSALVKVEAGMTLRELNEVLHELGLALENLGDIDRQTIAGAISTGTHGTGARLRNLSAQVEAMEIVTAAGELRELTVRDTPDLLRAARISIGALGAIYSVTVRAVPEFVLHRVDTPRPLEEVLADIDELASRNDHFEFFVFPYTDTALVLERNRTDLDPAPRGDLERFFSDVVVENLLGDLVSRLGRRFPALIPRIAGFAARAMTQGEQRDRSYRLFANERRIRFTEMEYGIPREHGPEAVRRVLAMIRERSLPVGFPIEFRLVAPDDAFLSPSFERETAYVAVHQYRGMEWRPYFEAVEEIMNGYGGRPHWGKRHFQSAATLSERYPRFEEFLSAREELDPGRAFRNEYTDRVLGP